MNMMNHLLTQPQMRVWLIDQMNPGTPINNLGGTVRFRTNLNIDWLKEAINYIIRNQGGMRARFFLEEGQAFQYVEEFSHIDIPYLDFSKSVSPETDFETWVEKESKKPFDIYRERMYRFVIIRFNQHETGYFINMHHMISDGWSFKLLTEQILRQYSELAGLNTEPVTLNAGCYTDYIETERGYFDSDRYQKDKRFWREMFANLDLEQLMRTSEDFSAKRLTFFIKQEYVGRIADFAQANKLTLNTFFTGAISLFLSRITQQNNVIIGIPVLNRSGGKEKKTIGMYTSTMPIHVHIGEEKQIIDYFVEVQRNLTKCYFHQRYPYNYLVEDLQIRRRGYDQLFQYCVNYSNAKLPSSMGQVEIVNEEFFPEMQPYALHFLIKDWYEDGTIRLDIDYKNCEYTETEIRLIFNQLIELIERIVANPYMSLRSIDILSEADKRKLLYEYNLTKTDYPKDKLYHQLVEVQALATPDRIAVTHGNKSLTYRELNARANQLARFLQVRGIRRGQVVALIAEHSMNTVVSVLAVMKAGGVYLPLDPEYPRERMQYILDNSGANLILTNVHIDGGIGFKGDVVHLESDDLFCGDATNLETGNSPDDLVYIIYTSGSTGTPKGVMVHHRGLVNYVSWAARTYITDRDDKFALYTSLAFDLTITSMLVPLIAGNEVIVYRQDAERFVLHQILEERRASIVKITPAHLALIQDYPLAETAVRVFVVGGEMFQTALAKTMTDSSGGRVAIYNEYGPTEAVVGCMIYKFNELQCNESVLIGKPISNVQILLLDSDKRIVPFGSVGEIYISGDGVASGYINAPELTADKFTPSLTDPDRNMYRTGDLARWLPNGEMEYIGRADHQIKLNGYRIELGEIENRACMYEAVKEAAVKVFSNSNGHKYLVLYVVGSREITWLDLKDFLVEYLPGFMIPQSMVVLDRMPLTINGKIDRDALAVPDSNSESAELTNHSKDEGLQQLHRIIKDVLGIEALEWNDNFYFVGGDSIKAIQIASKFNEDGRYYLKPKDILMSSVVGDIAFEKIYRSDREHKPAQGLLQSSPIINWFFANRLKNVNYYNQSVLLRVLGVMDRNLLEHTVQRIMETHDSLRLYYDQALSMLKYKDLDPGMVSVDCVDLSIYPAEVRWNLFKDYAVKLKSSINVTEGPLFKAGLYDFGDGEQRLLLTAHHLVVDGLSWRVILEDMNLILSYEAGENSQAYIRRSDSYQDWVNALYEYKPTIPSSIIDYWNNLATKKPTRFPESGLKEKSQGIETLHALLSAEDTHSLLTSANRAYGTQSLELIFAALARSLEPYAENRRVVIEVEGHGREEIGKALAIDRTVGWFTSLYPLELICECSRLSDHVKSIKEQIRSVPNKGFDYGIIQYLGNADRIISTDYIRFNFLGEADNTIGSYFEWAHEDAGPDTCESNPMTCLLAIDAMIVRGQLRVAYTFDPQVCDPDATKQVIASFLKELKEIIAHCSAKEKRDYTPSDFDLVKLSQEDLNQLFE